MEGKIMVTTGQFCDYSSLNEIGLVVYLMKKEFYDRNFASSLYKAYTNGSDMECLLGNLQGWNQDEVECLRDSTYGNFDYFISLLPTSLREAVENKAMNRLIPVLESLVKVECSTVVVGDVDYNALNLRSWFARHCDQKSVMVVDKSNFASSRNVAFASGDYLCRSGEFAGMGYILTSGVSDDQAECFRRNVKRWAKKYRFEIPEVITPDDLGPEEKIIL